MILTDTSVWNDFFRGIDSPEAAWLATAIAEEKDICICGLILTEVLQGIRDDRRFGRIRADLSHLIYLPMTRRGFELAAGIYREARKRGRMLRHTMDCIIAACAIEHRVPLLHKDKDFKIIADLSGLRIQPC